MFSKSAGGQSVAISHVCLHVCVSEDSAGRGGSLFFEFTLILLTVTPPSLSLSLSSTLRGIPCYILTPSLKNTDGSMCVCECTV